MLNLQDLTKDEDEQLKEYIAESFSPDEVFDWDTLANWARQHKLEIFGYQNL